jgi:hypothetical protein
MASATEAVQLIVIERRDGDALLAHLAARTGVIGVVPHQGRHVERGREPGLALLEQVLEPRVGVLRASEAGEHPHRPEAAAVHRRIDAARERILAGVAEALLVRAVRDVLGRVEGLHRNPGQRLEPHVPLRRLADERLVRPLFPLSLAAHWVLPLYRSAVSPSAVGGPRETGAAPLYRSAVSSSAVGGPRETGAAPGAETAVGGPAVASRSTSSTPRPKMSGASTPIMVRYEASWLR